MSDSDRGSRTLADIIDISSDTFLGCLVLFVLLLLPRNDAEDNNEEEVDSEVKEEWLIARFSRRSWWLVVR